MINGEASVADWNAGRNMYIMGKLTDVNLNKEGISTVMSNVAGKDPPIFQQLLETVEHSRRKKIHIEWLKLIKLSLTINGRIKKKREGENIDGRKSIPTRKNKKYRNNGSH